MLEASRPPLKEIYSFHIEKGRKVQHLDSCLKIPHCTPSLYVIQYVFRPGILHALGAEAPFTFRQTRQLLEAPTKMQNCRNLHPLLRECALFKTR